jgi:hypothetical protein
MSESHRTLTDATEEALLELTEEQLMAYFHVAEIITKIQRRPRQVSIRKYSLRKDKSELDPGETK